VVQEGIVLISLKRIGNDGIKRRQLGVDVEKFGGLSCKGQRCVEGERRVEETSRLGKGKGNGGIGIELLGRKLRG